MSTFNAGDLVFTGAGAGVVLGYAEREGAPDAAGNPTTEQVAIVGRFASSEEVDPVNLASSPNAPADTDNAAAGAVPVEPSHEGDATTTDTGPSFASSSAEGRQDPITPAATTSEREAEQDAELADLRARVAAYESAGTTTEPASTNAPTTPAGAPPATTEGA